MGRGRNSCKATHQRRRGERLTLFKEAVTTITYFTVEDTIDTETNFSTFTGRTASFKGMWQFTLRYEKRGEKPRRFESAN